MYQIIEMSSRRVSDDAYKIDALREFREFKASEEEIGERQETDHSDIMMPARRAMRARSHIRIY